MKAYLLKKTKLDYLNLFYNILCFEGGHLWFLYIYILIIILYPSFEGLGIGPNPQIYFKKYFKFLKIINF